MKKPSPPDIIILAIMTTVTVFSWVFFSVFRILTTKPSPVVPPEVLEPLSPTLDQAAIDKIQGRVFIPNEELPATIISQSPLPGTALPTPEEVSESPQPVATESGAPTPTP